ncbi:MAG: SsrA-binding protein SmpB [Clostridiales bacterium]|nr:SsrA-binding protein SmpB [Clostridiales bacterium]MCF8021619.1 SsrA-binding protein SmpB [Clostridiales bacterium]
MSTSKNKVIAVNRKAWHDFHVLEKFEAGLHLQGTEVKSIRAGRVNLKDSYARVDDGDLLVYNMHIAQYEQGNQFNHEPKRSRKLLMHKREIMRLLGKTREKGLTLVPLRVYFNGRWAKVELALVKGKRVYDKREDAKAKDAKREIERELKNRQYK